MGVYTNLAMNPDLKVKSPTAERLENIKMLTKAAAVLGKLELNTNTKDPIIYN